MAYTDPTPADIKLDFPQFAAVADSVIQRVINRNNPSTGVYAWVDQAWLESDYTWAWELLTAYWLTQMGQGTGTGAELAGQGLSGVSRLKSGALDVSFKSASDGGTSGVPAPWNENIYGVQFYQYLRKNRGGVVTAAGAGCGFGAQATDLPFAWAYNGRGL